MPKGTRDKPSYASLFCGCGGFDLGFLQAGYECTAAFDLDPVAVAVYRRNLGNHVQEADLCKPFEATESMYELDVLLAGPPCQGFSTAGRRMFHDPRNALLVRASEIAAEIKPRAFVVENVTGVLSGAHRQYWHKQCSILHAAGYKLQELICDGAKLGIAQTRKRVLLVAVHGDKEPNISLPDQPQMALREALRAANKAANDQQRPLSPESEVYRIAARIEPGQKLCNVRGGGRAVHTWDIPQVFGETTRAEREVLWAMLRLRRRLRRRATGDADPVAASDVSDHIGYSSRSILAQLRRKGYVRRIGTRYDLTHTFNGKFRRLEWDKPAPTVDTRFGDPRYFLHPEENRGFTVREAARIQGFPDSFVFDGSEQDQFRLVGNAVPPPLAHTLGVALKEVLL